MSANSSSSASNSSLDPLFRCFSSTKSLFIFSAFSVVYILLVPLFVSVLFLGYQQWRRQRSMSMTAARHCDVFTYHSVCMQLSTFVGFVLFVSGGFVSSSETMLAGLCVWSCASLGQALFHILTCVERYLAVVHPVTYLGLRQAGGVRIRNISVGCVWLLSVGWQAVNYLGSYEINMMWFFSVTGFFLAVICFCSISVLCALKRPIPGQVGGNRERVDQSKQRAFHTIVVIMAVLLISFGGDLLVTVIYSSVALGDPCAGLTFTMWFDLPSSVVLPLLFLHRAGKLQCCKEHTEAGGA